MYRLIILDFDGTIADTNRIITATMQATLRQLGLPDRSPEDCRRTIGLPLGECFRTLMPLSDSRVQLCCETYNRLFEENTKTFDVKPFPGVMESIHQWHADGIVMTLASSRGHATLAALSTRLGLDAYISLTLGVEDVEMPKPHPCPVLTTLDRFGISADDTLVVGDMTFDILMGKQAGCHTCGVTYGNGTADELRAAGADFIVDSFCHIPTR